MYPSPQARLQDEMTEGAVENGEGALVMGRFPVLPVRSGLLDGTGSIYEYRLNRVEEEKKTSWGKNTKVSN